MFASPEKNKIISMIPFIMLISIAFFALWFFSTTNKRDKTLQQSITVSVDFLEENVLFYKRLDAEEKDQFETDVKDFLLHVTVTGIDTTVADTDKLLIASAAVIPIFYFKQWKYQNLREVLVYSDAINMNFESSGNTNRDILGMVGAGSFEGKMLLSKHALQQGFKNQTDKSNTAIHEFIHLIDKSDGDMDGIPGVLLDKLYVIPWINMIHEQMQQIAKNKSDISPYATMNKAEFFAVVAEYFFERPALLEEKHPRLYAMLSEMFDGR